ncbi:MAG TPA: amidohydrolase family protein, partial [Thermomicrobiales bacterium]|nr:amidohydrolase family protein [Thermomicrobiales bacterium]
MRKFALYNGNIHTLDAGRPHAEALGIVDGRVAAVGTRAEVRDALGASDGVDLRGRTVVPGLIDAHLHFLGLSLALREVHLTGARSIAEVVDRVAARAAETPPDQWITGGGWNANHLRDGR